MARFFPIIAIILTFFLFFALRNDINYFVKAGRFADSPAKNELSSGNFINEITSSDGKFNPKLNQAIWFNKPVAEPTDYLSSILGSKPNNILGDNSSEKWIDIDLTTQTLRAYQGNQIVYTFPVSSGLPWFPTVTGEFHIWAKVSIQRMVGGSVSDGTYYDLPNVPFVQYFYNGYGLHGTYWHHDFGKPRSHGCINLSIEDAKTLFYWTNPPLPSGQSVFINIPPDQSTRVVVHGTTPTNIN